MMGDVRFTLDDAARAFTEWGANCGPGAIAAVLGMTLDELRPRLRDFESKRYTNPSLMYAILRDLRVTFTVRLGHVWPDYGLVRVQWEGPWTAPGVPIAARYRHTHWVGARHVGPALQVFDINAMCVGGWLGINEWSSALVPWLLRECEPKASGKWHLTHALGVARPT